jgi:CubicO group peptidase (beta-lactamase class C family)
MLGSLLAATVMATGPQSAIANYLDSYAKAGYLSGTVLVAKDDKVILEKSYGFADYENRAKNENNTRFNIASVTKWMTLTVLLQMIYSREIGLNDTLERYLPGVASSLLSR